MMELEKYKAEDLFEWVTREGYDFTLLDVRNEEEFGRFKVEGPYLSKMINVSYIDFIEKEEESVAKVQVPKDETIRIVCEVPPRTYKPDEPSLTPLIPGKSCKDRKISTSPMLGKEAICRGEMVT